jgi:mRNA-degrading endonuclease YafQ of YafQ-DinJ toxin-antitoxin module
MIDPFAKTFRTHKLTGKLKIYYSSSINYTYRFVWILDGDLITLVNIGDHSIYR